MQLLERAQAKQRHDVVLAVGLMHRGQVYQREVKDARRSALGTIRNAERMDAHAVLDGSDTGFIDQMSAVATQQAVARETESTERRRQISAAFAADVGDRVSDDEWDD